MRYYTDIVILIFAIVFAAALTFVISYPSPSIRYFIPSMSAASTATTTTSAAASTGTAGASAPPTNMFSVPSSAWDSCAVQYEAEAVHITGPHVRYALNFAIEKYQQQHAPIRNVTDVACGSGIASITMLNYPSVQQIIATDYSEVFCSLTNKQFEKWKVEHQHTTTSSSASSSQVKFQTLQLDAAHLSSIPDASQDFVCCTFGLMLLPDPATAAREMCRILKPGGIFLAITWATPDRSQFHTVLASVGKIIAAARAKEAAAAAAQTSDSSASAASSAPPVPAACTAAAASMVLPLSSFDSWNSFLANLPLTPLCLEYHTEPTRMYNSPTEFWNGLKGSTPMGGRSAVSQEVYESIIQHLNQMFGKEAQFSLQACSIVAIARKK